MPAAECVETAELFAGLSPEQRRRVTACAVERVAPRGTGLFEVGGDARELYVVCRGEVELTFPLLVMGETRQIRFQILNRGSTVAWSALVPPHRLTMSARAASDAALCAFPRQALLDLFASDPAIGHAVMYALARVVAGRLVELQALWVREMQRNVSQTYR